MYRYFHPYSLYADAITEYGAKYEINPLFVLANLVNQRVILRIVIRGASVQTIILTDPEVSS